MRIACDYEKCTGCLACVVTCLDHHYSANDHAAVPLRQYAKAVQPSGYTTYHTESCRHCENAPCAAICPRKAISRTEKGWIAVNQAACIGCRLCRKACPFDIPQFNSDNKMVKCDGCSGDPSCVKICPNGALSVV